MLTIRRLDPVTDEHHFLEAFRWLDEAPGWRRECEAVFGTLDREEFMAGVHSPGRIDVGVFVDEALAANIVLTLRAAGVYELHLDAHPATPRAVVVEAGCDVRDLMFGRHGARLGYLYTPSFNRPVRSITKAIGFRETGVMMLHGTCRGRLIEWVHSTIDHGVL